MPIEYTIDTQLHVVREAWTATVNATDLRAHLQRLLTDPIASATRRTIVDLRDASIEFDGSAFFDVVRSVITPKLQGNDWVTAVIVATPAQFGAARQYFAYADDFTTSDIFTEEAAAVDWMRRQRCALCRGPHKAAP